MNKIKELQILSDFSIKDVLKKLNDTGEKVLMIVDKKDILVGTITDGDIRRSIISGIPLDVTIDNIYNKKPIIIHKKDFNIEKAKELLIKNKIDLIPVVDEDSKLVDYISWNKAFADKEEHAYKYDKISVPVVIMAGGKGTRLEPFTKVLPKPLIPVNDKTIAEHIIEQFKKNGIEKFYFTLNYRGEMIQSYFNSINHGIDIQFLFEEDFYGTAGSLIMLKDIIDDTFIVSNCDILVDVDFAEVLNFHNKNKSMLTIISAIQHHKIPYGVVDFTENGIVTKIREKPEHTVTINTGVYIINKECLNFIPKSKIFHMTDLIEYLLVNEKKVCTYPINSNGYNDIGQWEEYKKTINKLRIISD